MSEFNLQIDDQTLDELVTGSLHGERYRSVLQALEARPHLWRKCAIAFLQEQALTQDLKALSQGDIDWTSELRNSVGKAATQRVLQEKPARPSLEKHAKLWHRIGALAALLVVSFSIGWMGAGLRSSGGGNNDSNSSTSTQAGILGGGTLPSLAGSQANGPANHVSRSIPSSSSLANSDILPIDLQVPPQLLELERAGRIRIETYDAIMRVQLDDGSSAIVPVQQFRVVPVIFAY